MEGPFFSLEIQPSLKKPYTPWNWQRKPPVDLIYLEDAMLHPFLLGPLYHQFSGAKCYPWPFQGSTQTHNCRFFSDCWSGESLPPGLTRVLWKQGGIWPWNLEPRESVLEKWKKRMDQVVLKKLIFNLLYIYIIYIYIVFSNLRDSFNSDYYMGLS